MLSHVTAPVIRLPNGMVGGQKSPTQSSFLLYPVIQLGAHKLRKKDSRTQELEVLSGMETMLPMHGPQVETTVRDWHVAS